MPLLSEDAVRDAATTTLHKLIESQSIHLSGTGGPTEIRAKNDVAYLQALFNGLLELYRLAP